MANIRSFETKETLLIDAGALKAKANIALSQGDQRTAYNFNRAADKLMRKAEINIPEGVEAPKGKEGKSQEVASKPRRHRRTKAEMQAFREEQARMIMEGKAKPKRHRRTKAEMEAARAQQGQASNTNTETPKRGRRAKVQFNVGDTVTVPRSIATFSDDPRVPNEGKPAGRSYKVTLSEVDTKGGRVGWKGNAGYTYWANAKEVTLAHKGEEEKAA